MADAAESDDLTDDEIAELHTAFFGDDRGLMALPAAARTVVRQSMLLSLSMVPDPETSGLATKVAGRPAGPNSRDFPDEHRRLAAAQPKQDADDSAVPPADVAEEAARGLAWRREHGRGGTEVGWARARDLANRRAVSFETVQRMVSFFARHQADAEAEGWSDGEPGFPSAGRIAWALWGGDAGRRWAEARLAARADDDTEGVSGAGTGEVDVYFRTVGGQVLAFAGTEDDAAAGKGTLIGGGGPALAEEQSRRIGQATQQDRRHMSRPPIEAAKQRAIFKRDGNRCIYCKKGPKDGVKLTPDHIVPFGSGGTDHESNLVTCCAGCNCARGNRGTTWFVRILRDRGVHITAASIGARQRGATSKPLADYGWAKEQPVEYYAKARDEWIAAQWGFEEGGKEDRVDAGEDGPRVITAACECPRCHGECDRVAEHAVDGVSYCAVCRFVYEDRCFWQVAGEDGLGVYAVQDDPEKARRVVDLLGEDQSDDDDGTAPTDPPPAE